MIWETENNWQFFTVRLTLRATVNGTTFSVSHIMPRELYVNRPEYVMAVKEKMQAELEVAVGKHLLENPPKPPTTPLSYHSSGTAVDYVDMIHGNHMHFECADKPTPIERPKPTYREKATAEFDENIVLDNSLWNIDGEGLL